MSEADCPFCKIRDGTIPAEIVHRDEHVIAFKDSTPRAPLHLLVIPTRHIAGLTEAVATDAEVFGRLMLTGARLAEEAGYGPSGYRVVMNAGPDAGQSVFHAHLHVFAGRALAWPPG